MQSKKILITIIFYYSSLFAKNKSVIQWDSVSQQKSSQEFNEVGTKDGTGWSHTAHQAVPQQTLSSNRGEIHHVMNTQW